jgi:hypothetical protein
MRWSWIYVRRDFHQSIAHCQSGIANCFAGEALSSPAKQLAMPDWQWAMAWLPRIGFSFFRKPAQPRR